MSTSITRIYSVATHLVTNHRNAQACGAVSARSYRGGWAPQAPGTGGRAAGLLASWCAAQWGRCRGDADGNAGCDRAVGSSD